MLRHGRYKKKNKIEILEIKATWALYCLDIEEEIVNSKT